MWSPLAAIFTMGLSGSVGCSLKPRTRTLAELWLIFHTEPSECRA